MATHATTRQKRRVERFDAAGWAIDPVRPVARAEAFSLFCPDASARFEVGVLASHARSLLSLSLSVDPVKHFARGGVPIADAALIRLSGGELADSEVLALMFPVERAWPLRQQAFGLGAAGMELVVARGRKIFQIPLARVTGDPRAALAVACVLSASLLAAVLAPDEDVVFGVKGARERLAAQGLAVRHPDA